MNSNPDPSLATGTLATGTLDANLSALADWLDDNALSGFAEAVRDWHPERDGIWVCFARGLAETILQHSNGHPTPLLEQAIQLFRTPRHRLREKIKLCADGPPL